MDKPITLMAPVIYLVITPEDIAQGVRVDPEHCPVARALVRATGAYMAIVGPGQMTWVMWGGATYSVPITKHIERFMRRFDCVMTVRPCINVLRAPATAWTDSYLELANEPTMTGAGEPAPNASANASIPWTKPSISK